MYSIQRFQMPNPGSSYGVLPWTWMSTKLLFSLASTAIRSTAFTFSSDSELPSFVNGSRFFFGEIEVDGSYFGGKQIKGKRGSRVRQNARAWSLPTKRKGLYQITPLRYRYGHAEKPFKSRKTSSLDRAFCGWFYSSLCG
jgi:hypothetical protein